MKITKVHEVAYHRNGIAGAGFHLIRFAWEDDGETGENFLATIFDAPTDEDGYAIPKHMEFVNPQVAIIDLDKLPAISMGDGNAWRGDRFADVLYGVLYEGERAERAAMA